VFSHRIIVGELETNCYAVGDESAKDVLLIDPGDDPERILYYLDEAGVTPTEIVLTHSHCDHIVAAPKMREHFKIPISIHELDAPNLEDPKRNFSDTFGETVSFKADRILTEGDSWPIGKSGVTVLHTPGHSPGSITLVASSMIFSGDTIFKNGIGRTDLPGGKYTDLVDSIKRLLGLRDEIIIYPGHGPRTTIGDERYFLTGL